MWLLSWKNPLGQERISLRIAGGSCQSDSHGFGPAVAGCEICSDDLTLGATISGPRIVEKGRPFEVGVELANTGTADLEIAYRLLLNPGWHPHPESAGGATLTLTAGGCESLAIPVRISEAFNHEVLKICAYRSVSTVVELFAGDTVFWLSCQHKGNQW